MKRAFELVASICALVTACGCTAGSPEAGGNGEDTQTAVSAFMTLNSMAPEALDATTTYPSALSPAMLAGAPLDPSALTASALAAIKDPGDSGALSRSLLSYTVGCALDGTQSFAFSWVDASNVTHEENYPGSIGLATGWASHPIDASGRGWVSACLIARVNHYGIPVHLSARGDNAALVASAEEKVAYPNEEGAFWGDLFRTTPVAYACDIVSNDDNSRAEARVCAAGYVDGQGNVQGCGIVERVGSCNAACAPLMGVTLAGSTVAFHHPSCATAASGLTTEVMTVFLE
jgi:hypothetical protein